MRPGSMTIAAFAEALSAARDRAQERANACRLSENTIVDRPY